MKLLLIQKTKKGNAETNEIFKGFMNDFGLLSRYQLKLIKGGDYDAGGDDDDEEDNIILNP